MDRIEGRELVPSIAVNREKGIPVKNQLPLVSSLLVLGVCGLFLGLDPAVASDQEIVVTEEDFKEDPVYSPYVDRAYPD